jgi:hypothetical protein
MARSTYIYTVEHWVGDCYMLVAAFTVKHELLTYLDRHRPPHKDTRLQRVPDGFPLAPQRVVVDITSEVTWAQPLP